MTNGPPLRHWSVDAAEAAVLADGLRPARLRIVNGLIYTFLRIPVRDWAGTLAGELHAAGQGTLSLRTSTCLRPPGSGAKGFSHSIKKEVGPFTLAPEPSAFRFQIPIQPYEQGYLYISVSGTGVLSHVSGVLAEPLEK